MKLQGRIVGLLLCAATALSAREFRAPAMVNPRGYDFDIADLDGYHFEVNTTMYNRQANRAFTSEHGTKTQALTGIIFNSDEFRLSHIFSEAKVPLTAKDYNPFMRIMKIKPRADYTEYGMHLGFTVSKEVIRDKGSFGVRVNMPFKSVAWTRKDAGSRHDMETKDIVSKEMLGTISSPRFAYRLDFLEAIPTGTKGSQVTYSKGDITVFGSAKTESDGSKGAAAIYSPEGIAPKGNVVGAQPKPTSSSTATVLPVLPATLDNMSVDTQYAISGSTNYSSLDVSTADTATRVQDQDKKAQVWITSLHKEGTTGSYATNATSDISNGIDDYLGTFTANSYEWLHDHGYEFDNESNKQVGVGDIDVDLFYQHVLNDRMTFEVFAGGRIPTGAGKDYSGNPYRAHVGNGEHMEVRMGGKAQIEARHWLALVIDGSYSAALSSTEKRCAVPEKSLIKNMGQAVDADVKWHHAVGNCELHFCHPRTTDLTGMLGYQMYYKSKDTVAFKKTSVDSWLGKLYDGTAYTQANTTTLSNELAAANTDQYAHRIKGGLTYQFSDWFSMTMGGAFTFAGKNMPKDFDMFGSCSVTF